MSRPVYEDPEFQEAADDRKKQQPPAAGDNASFAAAIERLTWRVDNLLERVFLIKPGETRAILDRLAAFTEGFRDVEKRFSELAFEDSKLRAEVVLLMNRVRDLLCVADMTRQATEEAAHSAAKVHAVEARVARLEGKEPA